MDSVAPPRVLVGQKRERFLSLLVPGISIRMAAQAVGTSHMAAYRARRRDTELDQAMTARVKELWAEWRAAKASTGPRKDRHLVNALRVWGPWLVGYDDTQRAVHRLASQNSASGGLSRNDAG